MMNKSKLAVTLFVILVIAVHITGYANNSIGLDQLFSCIVGYIALWGILMSTDFGNKKELDEDEKFWQEQRRKFLDGELKKAADDLVDKDSDVSSLENEIKSKESLVN